MYTQALVEQAQKKEDLPPNRGNILDRHNRLLSRNIIHYTLSANPSKVLDIQELAEAIHVRTGEPVEKYIDKLNKTYTYYVNDKHTSRFTYSKDIIIHIIYLCFVQNYTTLLEQQLLLMKQFNFTYQDFNFITPSMIADYLKLIQNHLPLLLQC